MRRRERIALVAVSLGAVILAVLVLTYTGSHSLGPLSRLLGAIGVRVSDVETRYAQRVRGGGRAEKLVWLQTYRTNAPALRAPDRMMLGVYDATMPASYETAAALEKQLGVTFPLLHFYTAWGDKPEQQFPARNVQIISNLGSIPVITWAPTATAFSRSLKNNSSA